MPRRSPGKTVKSLQPPATQLSRKSQSWNPIRLKVSTVTAPGTSLRNMFTPGSKDSPKKSKNKSPIKAFPVARTPPENVQTEMESPLLVESEPPEESKLSFEEKIDVCLEESELVHSPTWPNADLNTSAESWQSFENGGVFADAGSTKSPTTSSRKEAKEDAAPQEDPFTITYQNQSAKWLRLYRATSQSKVESPKDVMMYGESKAEFRSFGRRSLLKALSGTTQGEF